jgi:hypothetical protein
VTVVEPLAELEPVVGTEDVVVLELLEMPEDVELAALLVFAEVVTWEVVWSSPQAVNVAKAIQTQPRIRIERISDASIE